ncbi:MAG: MBOAT family protein [Acidobacteriota bacterium]
MVFTTQIFLFWFLPLTLLLYYAMPTLRARGVVLLLMSYLFYGWWRPDFVLLMIGSSSVDYVCGRLLGSLGRRIATLAPGSPEARALRARQRVVLLVSIGVNVTLLGYFKYANFGVETLNAILARFHVAPIAWAKVVLPIGISFYTFESMSYAIDVYRGEVEPERSYLRYAGFIALFPHLVAGPIMRYKALAAQLASRKHSLLLFSTGVLLFQMGFAKKLLVADNVAPVADAAFALADPSTREAWLGTLAYALQIYFDFSGYSDMAIGLGMMFGFTLPWNFDAPYRSRSVTDFWRRWHISLSTWLRDYLYISMGGNRKGPVKTYLFLAITMLLGGLWHGAAWTFIAWGAYQGAWLVVERLQGKRPFFGSLPAPIQVLATFAITLFGWVFFRADRISQAFHVIGVMLGVGGGGPGWLRLPHGRLELLAMASGIVIAFAARTSQQIVRAPSRLHLWGVPLLFLVAVLHLFFKSYTPFLYFQF